MTIEEEIVKDKEIRRDVDDQIQKNQKPEAVTGAGFGDHKIAGGCDVAWYGFEAHQLGESGFCGKSLPQLERSVQFKN